MATPLLEQLWQLFNSPAKRGGLLIGFVLLLSLIGFGYLIFWNNAPDYQTLFSNLSQEDASEMVNKLKEKKILFQLSGNSILVPKEQVYDIRLSMAAEGLPKGGGVGFEVFDRTNLGATDFVQKMNYQRAMQGELSRTIKQIKAVEHARVHIVSPKESLFVEEKKKPTASVFIKTRSGMSLEASQVEGIVHLVASAVEGLDTSHITVVDTSGKILSKRNENTPIAQLTTNQLEYQRNIEEGLKKKIQGMLEGVLGHNRAVARVSADIDFQQIDITEERFDPQTIVRSEQKSSERSSMTSGAKGAGEGKIDNSPVAKPSGGKGTESPEPSQKVMPGISASAPINANSAERQSETRNYEISKINKHIKSPVGTLKKVSVAVIVDGTYKENSDAQGKKVKQFVSRSPEEMKSLERIVKKAVGYDEKRGDQVEVVNMPFSWSITEEEESKTVSGTNWKEYLLLSYKPLVSLILILLFIFFVVRPLLKKRNFLPQESVAYLPQQAQPALSAEPSLVSKSLDLREQTIQLVQGDSTKAVGIVKTWLNERD
ncbi:MAG: flagellar M-ring protein FliF [Deltaproteobacteria bacterium]|nr:flagellar M-ring protein FliF [Deltaproteobacteria bacterium]